ncbi:MAG TPA: hypothetical protein VMB26_13745 [Candidatus Binataceae bacterium]|nr:hypothetical protein [Candidatus Binataceae bacterium]
MLSNPLVHTFNVTQEVIVPKAQGSIYARTENLIASRFRLRLRGVVSAVGFDDRATFPTTEVDDRRSGGKLTAEFKTV